MEKDPHRLPTVTVLMATYNGERYLAEQIDSILGQKNVNVNLYIRDDRSADNTVGIINNYISRTSNVFLLNTLPGQSGVTKNFFSIVRDIDTTIIDYMAYCDQDDIWLDNKLEMAVNEIKKNQVDCYASNLLMGDKDAKIIENKSVVSKLVGYLSNYKSNQQTKYDYYFEAASAGCTLVLNKRAAVYFRASVTKLFDRIPADASHDWSTYALTRVNGFSWYIDKNAYIIYRQHTENAYGANTGLKGISKLLDLFTSGWYRKHILMIDDLYNQQTSHPSFIEMIRNYTVSSFVSRYKLAFVICKYRRKMAHRIALFFLILFGFFK